MFFVRAVFLASLFLATSAHSEPTAQESVGTQLRQLHWSSGKTMLPLSHSTLSLPPHYSVVTGEDARTGQRLIGNSPDSTVEGWAVNSDYKHEFIFSSFNNEGHIAIDDWSDVNSAAMLKEIIDNTEQANTERIKNAASALHVTGWLQEPAIDRATNTVYWTISARGDDGHVTVNSVALRLGRSGFEKLIWITDPTRFVPAGGGGELDVMLRAHDFDPGFRYTDFAPGDKVAAYGVAGLVATVAGVKLAKIAAAAGGLILLKKFGAILFLPLIFLFRYVKRLFHRKPTTPTT